MPQHRDSQDRMLVMDLDTLTQAERWPSTAWFSGVLRTADLFGDRVLLLDVQVLDGTFLLHAGPVGIDGVLGRPSRERPPFHVTARSADLGESLRRMALDAAGAYTAFEWPCLSSFGLAAPRGGSLAGRDPRALAECPVEDVPFVLAAELREAVGVPHGRTDQLDSGYQRLALAWQAWIDAARNGRLPVSAWDPTRYAVREQLRQRPFGPAGVPPEVVAQVRVCTRRSDLRRLLHRVETGDGDRPAPISPEQRSQTEQWWLGAYFASLATQHQANWFQLTPAPTSATATEVAPEDIIRLEGRSVDILGQLPGAAFAILRHQARHTVAAWVAAPTQKTADALGYAVRSVDTVLDLHADRRAAWMRLGYAVTPAVVGVATSLVSSFWAGIWVGVGAAFTVLVAIPVSDLVGLYQTRRSRLRAYLHVPGLDRA